MRTTIAVLSLGAVLAAAPAAAQAKELVKLEVCGQAGCVDRTKAGEYDPHSLLDFGASDGGPGRKAAFVRLRAGIGDGSGEIFGRVTMVYVPSLGLVQAQDGTWTRPSPAVRAQLQAVTKGVAPYPASKMEWGADRHPGGVAGDRRPPEVYEPAKDAARTAGAEDGTPAIVAPAVGGAAALALAGAAAVRRRRRRAPGGHPDQAAAADDGRGAAGRRAGGE
jgi:uncharacterized protein (TIGR03382 family)